MNFDKGVFGSRMKELRLERKLTLQEVANEIDVLVGSVGNLERGVKSPSIEMLFNLANFFNVSIDYLVGRTDKRQS